jgi:hypothetical protein
MAIKPERFAFNLHLRDRRFSCRAHRMSAPVQIDRLQIGNLECAHASRDAKTASCSGRRASECRAPCLIVWRWQGNNVIYIHPAFSRLGPQSQSVIAN